MRARPASDKRTDIMDGPRCVRCNSRAFPPGADRVAASYHGKVGPSGYLGVEGGESGSIFALKATETRGRRPP